MNNDELHPLLTERLVGNFYGDGDYQQNLIRLQRELASDDYLNDVLHSSRHLLELISDILDLSKIESGKEELSVSAIDLRHLLENSLSVIKESAKKKNIALSLMADDAPETIDADELKLKQILYNLVSNAVKFTPRNGKIRLAAELVDDYAPRPGDLPGSDHSPPATPSRCPRCSR